MRYEFRQTPDRGQVQALSDDLLWLRMPLPIKLDHINLWLLRDGHGWTVVDTGMHTGEAREVWRRVLAETLGGAAIRRVIVTHLHPDHVGNAGWLARRCNAELWMTREEYMLCRVLVADTGRPAPEEALRFYRAAGFSEEQLAHYRRVFGMFGRAVSALPESYHRIHEDEQLAIGERHWRVLVGRGHSPEHACLYDEHNNVLIGGDQLLPTISSNVSVYPTEPDANPLRAWLDSLHALKKALHEDVLVLPSHGRPFRGAHERLDALIAGHETSLDRLRELCREPRRAVDVFPALFRNGVRDDMLIFATGEAIAHLHYLMATGDIERRETGGVHWYRRA